MRVAVLTSNQPRHIALLEALNEVSDELVAVLECNTLFPGRVPDFFRRSAIMQRYFQHVIEAEQVEFGGPRPAPAGARTLSMKMGDLNLLSLDDLQPVLDCDTIIVFGASYIRGPLCEALVQRGALNIHMGVSPQYRGSSTNFWALYDERIDLVGATIHKLTAGLDSGPILFHALPATEAVEPFRLGMKAVRSAHRALVEAIADGSLSRTTPTPQDRTRELRYTRNADFTDDVALEYLQRMPTPAAVLHALSQRKTSDFIHPRIANDVELRIGA